MKVMVCVARTARPSTLPGVRIQAARDVEREHRAGLRVRVVDQLRVLAFDRAGEADAEQAVDDEIPAGVLAESRSDFVGKGDPEKPLLQDPRDDLRVAAVVAGAGEHQDVLALVREQRARRAPPPPRRRAP